MRRTRLRFESLQQVVGTSELSVIMLTDEARQRVLSVVCDELMTRQIFMRLHKPHGCNHLLPEALFPLLPSEYELMVVGVYDGQYQVVLMDIADGTTVRIRMSDAVLLHLSLRVPFYIEEGLMDNQSVPFDEHATGVAIPINTMDVKCLKMALEHAVDEENYEFASQLRDEINRRGNKNA